MSTSVLDPEDVSTLEYIVTHVFLPLQLPDGDDHSVAKDRALVGAVVATSHLYASSVYIDHAHEHQWQCISRMLDNLRTVVQFQSLDQSKTSTQLRNMNVGDVLMFPIRAQNAAVVFRKQQGVTVFEAFEASPIAENVMMAEEKLICSYPGPAIEVPSAIFDDDNFLDELASFLVHMNDDILADAAPTTRKAQSTVLETRDTTHPRYITELLTGILRSVGHPAEVTRISKRVGDDVVWNNSKLPWRRSSLWLLIRVVLQTTLERSSFGRAAYKSFMVFFMCCLGRERICVDLSNDLLQLMSAKISRRLRKLGSSAPDSLSRIVLETCTSLRSTLGIRWAHVQTSQGVSSWKPSELDLSQDTRLSLWSSSDYLRSCLANRSINSPHTVFAPSHQSRGRLEDFLSSDGVFFEEAYCAEPHVTLYDVESAVAQGIDKWVDQASEHEKACEQLEMLATKYSSSALKTYGRNPELLSIMLLTTIELWIALDKIAVKAIPMLADYSPEVPISLLEELLVSKSTHLHRLHRAHQYLSFRHSQSSRGSVFSPALTSNAFAVRYYQRSPHLQQLKYRIEEAAQLQVRDKIKELEEANSRHADLVRRAASIEHSYTTNWYGNTYHSSNCTKCDLEREQAMYVAVHEWPLPAEQLKAEVVVFELDCPVSFNMWRTATFHLLVDLCSPSALTAHNPYIRLDGYNALQPYLVRNARSRVSLASDTKPFVVSHYSTTSIPTSKERICVNNGLNFYGFDGISRIAVSSPLGQPNISKYCTHQLPSGPYQNLQKYVDTTSHTSNEILANQDDCGKDLSIHEYLAFGHLRSGGILQWLNILRELRGRTLSFRCDEVHFLFAQAASQVGPLGDTNWMWHQEMENSSFCHALLRELENLIRDVGANWLEGATMDTISFLLRRLLASNPNQPVTQKAVELLRVVRANVFHWAMELSDKLTKTPEDEEFRGFLRDNAAICRSTFDVEITMIHHLLSSAEDIDILLSSSILIHDHMPNKPSCLSSYSQLLLDRDRRLSLVLGNSVSSLIQVDSTGHGVNHAIRRFWDGYRPGSKWTPLSHPNSRWFSCMTTATAQQCSQAVHFNILDGSLLVDGKPLGRLPTQIVHHPLYDLIFGGQVLDVIPSDIPGMDYSTRGMIFNHQVFFCLRNNSDLVIRAKRGQTSAGDSEIMELIPQQKLAGDLPTVLIEGHAHWLNLSTSIMEFRPLDSIWNSSPANWMIDCTPGNYRMRKGQEFLVDIRSPSWAMVSDVLKPLDTPCNLIVSVSKIGSDSPSASLQLSVFLPRYGLSFYIDNDGDLQSQDIRGMVYDEDQCFATMFGLVDRLVLRPKTSNVSGSDLTPRCVLIPEGRVAFQKFDHHVRVRIITDNQSRVAHQTYRIDTDLGCLTTGSLAHKLYCAYLHALTSGCDVDPLTGRLGTEEALSLLWSPGCWSAMKVSSRDAELLGLIASLCPARAWYPIHLQCMQQVAWLDLPATSQHYELYSVAKAMKAHYERLLSFHESQPDRPFKEFPDRESHLLKRSARRAACLFPFSFSSQSLAENNCDIRYRARDLIEPNSGEHRAYMAATIVHQRAPEASIAKDILHMMESWSGPTFGDTSNYVELSLRYDRSWLAPNFSSTWIKLYNVLRRGDGGKWVKLLFTMPAMTYSSPNLSDLVPVLVAFASHTQFHFEDPPSYPSYRLSEKYYPSRAILCSYVSQSAYAFEQSPESSGNARSDESLYDLRQRQLKVYNTRLQSDTDTTVERLLEAWPCETPPSCSLSNSSYNVASFASKAQSHFSDCYRNLKLKEHLIRIQGILRNVPVTSTHSVQYSFDPSEPSGISPDLHWMLTMDHLLSRAQPWLPIRQTLPQPHVNFIGNTSRFSSSPLDKLITTAAASAVNPFQDRYVSALRASAECLRTEMTHAFHKTTVLPDLETLVVHYERCKADYTEGLHRLQHHLGPKSQSEQALEKSGQWPRLTPHTFFRLIASNSRWMISDNWRRCLILLALLALELQRSRRLLRLHLDHHSEELRKELQNEGCDGWSAEMHPDWLLIQLQGDFFVRRVQAEVAGEMISPRSGENTAMQLNMGEGKSSVIVPIVVSVLADGNQLVRVVVPKALTAQMFHLLVKRLGGLAGRRIYFLPFSRSLDINPHRVANLREIMSECIRERGVLVVQPEHILSLKLLSVEKQLPTPQNNCTQVGPPLLELQKWLHSCSRDILDESDEILHVRYQLVYTMGNQQHVEGFPERWTTTQQMLSLVKKHASSLGKRFPLGVECYQWDSPGSFPHFRILHADAGQELVSCILRDIIDDFLPNCSFAQLRSETKNAIRGFISHPDVSNETVQMVAGYARESTLWGALLLLRGLLATGILLFAFRERRWRVDYGLAPARTMLAVPYRAKDVPAQRAEFGHPDVAIILTCLSYYYGGLTGAQLRISFDMLLKLDDPSVEYDMWVRECSTIPEALQTLNGINLKSSEQWREYLHPLFSQNKATIDFYLSRVVFPREAKEFPSKLSCSGWDLAEKRERVVTGFSGTNDGQYLLPLHITQRDPDHQRGTNAKVLSYLLQPENNHYMCMTHENGERRTTREFLEMLACQEPEIRVLLDVGAQMLELENRELARTWLNISPDTSAAIYFNEDDELTVLARDGRTQPLSMSSFEHQLDQCVIYLDDAHTRGTDMKFPGGFRAAVTLGPKVTKDRLAQGCMRMRKLGHGHSIMFFAPLEVDRHIRGVAHKGAEDDIHSTDILHWAIRETCNDIHQRAPHWAQQGMDHSSRHAAWAGFCSDQFTAKELSERWLQPEAKSLEKLYAPEHYTNHSLALPLSIRQRCEELGILSLRNASMDEEQEREVTHEAERERQIERPARLPPATHSIHQDVVAFVTTGNIPENSTAFKPVFKTLDATSAIFNEADVWSSFVLATRDFEETVRTSEKVDDYLRPVHWMVSGKKGEKDVLVIMSPHEVNHLLSAIKSNKRAHLHLYTPRVTKSMQPCDDLTLYNVPAVPTGWSAPSHLMDQLNLFAGQLYLKDYESYIRVCRFLCVYARDLEGEENIEVGYNGFITPGNRPGHWRETHTFQSAPLPCLRVLIALRRKGMRFVLTQVGKLLDGRLLSEDDFEGRDA